MSIAAKFLEVQNELNMKLSPEWTTKGWAYPDAMFTEATEAYNHLNWEWWRATDRVIDWDQVKLEIVDVGHFLFSEIIAKGFEKDFTYYVAGEIVDQDYCGTPEEINVVRLKKRLKSFIAAVISYDASGRDLNFLPEVMSLFFEIVWQLGITILEFYTLFIGKVCLNQLRWKNGYKKGIYQEEGRSSREYYIKTWYEAGKDPVEDNVWLAEYAATLDPNDAEFKSKLETALDAKYKEVYELVWGK